MHVICQLCSYYLRKREEGGGNWRKWYDGGWEGDACIGHVEIIQNRIVQKKMKQNTIGKNRIG